MLSKSRIQSFKSLKPFSTFGIGGKAKQLIVVQTIEEMQDVHQYASSKHIPFIVIGKGSNVLFDDRGFEGLVIINKIDFIEWHAEAVKVGAGTSFAFLGMQMSKKGWGGLQFAAGIPGSVGGAIYMNAGAKGMDTSECLTHVGCINAQGDYIEKPKASFSFGYRTSSFHKETNAIIVSGTFQLKKNLNAQKEQLKMILERIKSQPYGAQSAGCFFRNPEGEESAGALIESCGLKDMRIGGAHISTVHANFIVNEKYATAQDVVHLASIVKKRVREKRGIDLQIEVQTIPYNPREHDPFPA